MNRNYVFVQCGIRHDRYQSLFFLLIDSGVMLIGDVNMTAHCVTLAEMKGCQVS